MYNGSTHFGRAYQEELLRTAGVGDEQGGPRLQRSQSEEPGVLVRLLTRLFGRKKEIQPTLGEMQKEAELELMSPPHW